MSALQSHRYCSFKPRQRSGNAWVTVLVVLGILALLVVLFMPATRNAREAARRSQCKNNLKQIGLALYNYHEVYKEFPPAYTVDEHGKPLHSWRTLILPFIDQVVLYQHIDLSKPWNDPANALAFQRVVPTYLCPSRKSDPEKTTYLAIIGVNTCFRPVRSLNLEEVTDGVSNTLAVVEVSAEHAVHWMSPHDADLVLLLGLSQEKDSLQHTGGYHTLLFDGSVRFLSINLQESILRALVSATGNEEVGEF
jgi:hypothetical protein